MIFPLTPSPLPVVHHLILTNLALLLLPTPFFSKLSSTPTKVHLHGFRHPCGHGHLDVVIMPLSHIVVHVHDCHTLRGNEHAESVSTCSATLSVRPKALRRQRRHSVCLRVERDGGLVMTISSRTGRLLRWRPMFINLSCDNNRIRTI